MVVKNKIEEEITKKVGPSSERPHPRRLHLSSSVRSESESSTETASRQEKKRKIFAHEDLVLFRIRFSKHNKQKFMLGPHHLPTHLMDMLEVKLGGNAYGPWVLKKNKTGWKYRMIWRGRGV